MILPTLILLSGVIDDLRCRKVHNILVLFCLLAALTTVGIQSGYMALPYALLSGVITLIICLPLVIAQVMGAGDMKLLMAFAVATGWSSALWVLIYSFLWGALLGVFRAILRGEGRLLLFSTIHVAMLKKASPLPLQKIPYTVALLFGWLTLLSLTGFRI